MNSFTRQALAREGFGGFLTFDQLRRCIGEVPAKGGVYLVIRDVKTPVAFLGSNPGGRFKGRDPTAALDALAAKWIAGCELVYVGKGDNIQRRLKQYADFGDGRPIGHWGGRYIWQLADSDRLLVAWMTCGSDETAAMMEARLLRRFKAEHGGRLPFANIADPT